MCALTRSHRIEPRRRPVELRDVTGNDADWTSFLLPGYRVSVAGRPESSPEPVVSFCEDEGRGTRPKSP